MACMWECINKQCDKVKPYNKMTPCWNTPLSGWGGKGGSWQREVEWSPCNNIEAITCPASTQWMDIGQEGCRQKMVIRKQTMKSICISLTWGHVCAWQYCISPSSILREVIRHQSTIDHAEYLHVKSLSFIFYLLGSDLESLRGHRLEVLDVW